MKVRCFNILTDYESEDILLSRIYSVFASLKIALSELFEVKHNLSFVVYFKRFLIEPGAFRSLFKSKSFNFSY